MTEQDLIELGFDRIDVPESQSNTGNEFYFFTHCGIGIEFFTNTSDETNEGDWWVSMFDNDLCKIFCILELKMLFDIISKNIIK
jgi:hypothetical protein